MKNEKVGLMIVGINGAIATTLTAGIHAIKKNLVDTIGLVSELTEFKHLNLPSIDSFCIGGWDLDLRPHIECIENHRIVPERVIESINDDNFVVKLFEAPKVGISNHILNDDGNRNVTTRQQAVEIISNDINNFKSSNNLDGCIIVNLSSTESLPENSDIFSNIGDFENAINNNNINITSGMIYAYAAIKNGNSYINFTPSLTAEIPALIDLAQTNKVAIAGNDGKTGQTLYKTVLAPMLKWRNLKLIGWYSTNILGNNDGRVLDDVEHKKTKILSKTKVLDSILGYTDFYHRVDINYYPPRGDSKEAWDSIDFKGWLDKEMSMKINWLGEDSILAAPLVLDLARFLWFTQSKGKFGIAYHLGVFFKNPINSNTHDFFCQMQELIKFCEEYH